MFGEEIDYEEEERRYQEEQQRQLAELEKRNKQFQRKVKVKSNKDEEEEEKPQVRSINLDEDENDTAPSSNQRQYYDETDPSEILEREPVSTPTRGDDVVESYLDSHEEMSKNFKKTSFGDTSRWGKGGELFDHTQLEVGSYLDTHEKDQQSYKTTKMSDSNRWGNYKIPDETEMEQGSFLEKQEKHAAEEAERQKQLKEQKIQEIRMEKGEGVFLDPKSNKFPYAELKGSFPKGVDPVKKELYLTAEEFNKVFGMSVAEYAKLTPFKKKNLKKQLKLF
jgi:hypothetical protein